MVAQFNKSKALSRKNTIWNLTPKPWFKPSFDGSTIMRSSTTEGVLCNSIGKMPMAYSRNYRHGSNNEVEALALLWGFRFIMKCGINEMIVKGEEMLIIKAAKGNSQSSWAIKVIIKEICKLKEKC